MNYEEFVQSSRRSVWIEEDRLSVYVRQTRRYLPFIGVYVDTIDLASIEVDPDSRGEGVFTRFLDRIESTLPEGRHLYVENVLTGRFATFFKERGYQQVREHSPDRCFLFPPLESH